MNSLIGKIKVMRSVLAQLSVIVSVILLLAACAEEGAKAVSDPEVLLKSPLPQGLPVFLEINEPYWAHDPSDTEDEYSLSLYSIDLPENGEAPNDPVVIFSTSSDQVTSLNTVFDENDQARTEISILVSEGNVYRVDHQKGADNSGSIRFLNHFINKVCEIIPVDVVTPEDIGNDVHQTNVLHSDEIIYVVTVEGAITKADCSDPSKFKRYYELPLNFQFNADDDDESKINVLKPPVSESLARGKLIFGWVDDEFTTLSTEDQRLTYGYLGYSSTEHKLRFYDETRTEYWCQPRALQTFDVEEIAPGEYSPEYLFELKELEQQQYQLQMGLDVFVFDSTTEIFSKPNNVSYCEFGNLSGVKSASDIAIEDILTDRIFKMDIVLAGTKNTSETVKSVFALSDDNEVVIVDDSKIYRYTYYVAPVPPPAPIIGARTFNVIKQAPISIDKMSSQIGAYPFSQFDLQQCADTSNVVECNDAHDLEANNWQFITGCEAGKGCSLSVDTADFCDTAEELVSDPNAGSLCTVLDYRHLEELNDASNDAEFRGFMQYDHDYIRSLGYILHSNSLFITARMNEKEILLRYFYNKDFTEVKVNRETVLFGERKHHFGFDVYINDDNLFATVLWETQKRENECYKNYQQVECDLGNSEIGTDSKCTKEDLDKGDCFLGFQEYESTTLFCSALEVENGDCNDDAIMTKDIVVNADDKSAKWLRMLDVSSSASTESIMYLLLDDKNTEVDEGVLTSPMLYTAENSDDAPVAGNIINDTVLGQLNGKVESVRSGWVANNSLAQFDVISEEVELLEDVVEVINSVSSVYMVTDPKLFSVGSDGLNRQVVNAGEVEFPRLITQFDTPEE
jgi:hypothetical protein